VHRPPSSTAAAVVKIRRVGLSGRPAASKILEGIDLGVKEGWRGRYYEDFDIGDVYDHPLGRTVLDVDNVWFTLLTQNTAPVHFDYNYAAQTEFGRPLVDSTFTLALVTGQSVTDISINVFANLGWDEVRLPTPVFHGDTIYSRSEVLEKRDSKSRPNIGIVTVRTTGFNQEGRVVITFKRTLMVYRRDKAPIIRRPTEQQRVR
jgi:itaconyl-CoA hydratase